MPLSGFEQNELCLFPLCSFPLCLFPVLNKINYAFFLYAPFLHASFRFCPFPFLPLSVSAPFPFCPFPDRWKTTIMPDSFMPSSAPPCDTICILGLFQFRNRMTNMHGVYYYVKYRYIDIDIFPPNIDIDIEYGNFGYRTCLVHQQLE